MKKAIIGCLAILLAMSLVMIAACELNEIGGVKDDDGPVYSNFILSDDGKKGTLYLDGSSRAVSKSARALSADMAKKGHDFYEVVFDDGTKTFRTSWYYGETATISGLTRTGGGASTSIDYVGKAVLMVGRQSDKVLFAIGELTHVDGAPSTVVTPTTTSVTFTIDSLVGNVANFEILTPDLSGSTTYMPVSGRIDYEADYDSAILTPASLNGVNYAGFQVPQNYSPITAKYTLDTVSGSLATLAALLYVSEAQNPVYNGAMIRDASIPNGIGGFIKFRSAAIGTNAKLTNNNDDASGVFDPELAFEIDTTNSNPGICALTFVIPVYGLSDVAGQAQSSGINTDAIEWKITPGFGGSQFDLDASTPEVPESAPLAGDGEPAKESLGGAVLLSVGAGSPDLIQINVK